nr:transposase [Mesobacillus maritimus]
MLFLCYQTKRWMVFFDSLAVLSALVFGNISAMAIFQIIKDDTVFMTNIHGLFLDSVFLITGAYLGLYLIYVLSKQTLHQIGDFFPKR